LREERSLRVFENGVLRRVFGPKRDEVTREWRKVHNEDCSGDKIKKTEMGGTCSVYGGGGRGVYRVLGGKPEGKRPLGRPRHRWEDNIKMDLQEVGLWSVSIWLRIGTGGGHWGMR
jgi:hypothetical protein